MNQISKMYYTLRFFTTAALYDTLGMPFLDCQTEFPYVLMLDKYPDTISGHSRFSAGSQLLWYWLHPSHFIRYHLLPWGENIFQAIEEKNRSTKQDQTLHISFLIIIHVIRTMWSTIYQKRLQICDLLDPKMRLNDITFTAFSLIVL